jgi:hypothetical protein
MHGVPRWQNISCFGLQKNDSSNCSISHGPSDAYVSDLACDMLCGIAMYSHVVCPWRWHTNDERHQACAVHPYIYIQTASLNTTDGAHSQIVPSLPRIMNSDMRIWNYTKLLQMRHDSLCLWAAHLHLTLLEQTILSMPERRKVTRSCSRQSVPSSSSAAARGTGRPEWRRCQSAKGTKSCERKGVTTIAHAVK